MARAMMCVYFFGVLYHDQYSLIASVPSALSEVLEKTAAYSIIITSPASNMEAEKIKREQPHEQWKA